MKTLFTFVLSLIFASLCNCAESRLDSLFVHANQAYEKSDFSQAVADYQKIIDTGLKNADLYYNYGNALYRENKLGMAILYFEKALKLTPTHSDAEANLRFARLKMIDKIEIPEPNFLTRILWFFHSAYSINTGLYISLGFFSATMILLSLVFFTQGSLKILCITLSLISALSLLLLLPSLGYRIYSQNSTQYAIVLTPATDIQSGPGDNFQTLAKVHEGTKFEILEHKGTWLSVKLPSGKGGFVKKQDLGHI